MAPPRRCNFGQAVCGDHTEAGVATERCLGGSDVSEAVNYLKYLRLDGEDSEMAKGCLTY